MVKVAVSRGRKFFSSSDSLLIGSLSDWFSSDSLLGSCLRSNENRLTPFGWFALPYCAGDDNPCHLEIMPTPRQDCQGPEAAVGLRLVLDHGDSVVGSAGTAAGVAQFKEPLRSRDEKSRREADGRRGGVSPSRHEVLPGALPAGPEALE